MFFLAFLCRCLPMSADFSPSASLRPVADVGGVRRCRSASAIVFPFGKHLQAQSDTAAPHRHRPLEARRLKARNQQTSADIGKEKQEKTHQNQRNVAKMGPKIDAKATKNLSKIEVASRMRLGRVLGSLREAKRRKGVTFLDPFLEPFWPKSRKKGVKKSMRKSMLKKLRK